MRAKCVNRLVVLICLLPDVFLPAGGTERL